MMYVHVYIVESLVLSRILLFSMCVLSRLRVGDRVCVTSSSRAPASKDEGGFLRYWGKVKLGAEDGPCELRIVQHTPYDYSVDYVILGYV